MRHSSRVRHRQSDARARGRRLGNWMLREASKEQRLLPAFKELNKIHAQLHDYAEELLLSDERDKLVGIKKLEALIVEE